MQSILEWRLWVPIISGYALALQCPMTREEGATLAQSPPPHVFGIVWPILYLLLGFSWSNSRNDVTTDIMHGVLTTLLCLWILVFSCLDQKKYGVYVLACVVATTACCMSLHTGKISKIALTPLLAWTSLAFQLNYHILDHWV